MSIRLNWEERFGLYILDLRVIEYAGFKELYNLKGLKSYGISRVWRAIEFGGLENEWVWEVMEEERWIVKFIYLFI